MVELNFIKKFMQISRKMLTLSSSKFPLIYKKLRVVLKLEFKKKLGESTK